MSPAATVKALLDDSYMALDDKLRGRGLRGAVVSAAGCGDGNRMSMQAIPCWACEQRRGAARLRRLPLNEDQAQQVRRMTRAARKACGALSDAELARAKERARRKAAKKEGR